MLTLDSSQLRDFLKDMVCHNPSIGFALYQVNKKINALVKEGLQETSRKIVKDLDLLGRYKVFKDEDNSKVFAVFIQLCQSLHKEAKRLGTEFKEDTARSSIHEHMLWCCDNYLPLLRVIQINTPLAKAQAFIVFVEAIVGCLGLSIPAGTTAEEFWQQDLSKNIRLQQLTSLTLIDRNLKFLPPQISMLTHLKELYLGKNQLVELPEEMSALTELTHLAVTQNVLSHMPKAFAALNKLVYVDFTDNQIEDMPSVLACKSIKWLYLGKNHISEIPLSINTLMNLQKIILCSNAIQSVPIKMFSQKNLKEINLAGNPLTEENKSTIKRLLISLPSLKVLLPE